MISAIVLGRDDAANSDEIREIVVRSLIWLVSAAVAGVVRDVTLAMPPGAPLHDIAEQAGCEIVEAATEEDRLAAALRKSRCDRVLVIRAGFQPEGALLEEIAAWDRRGRPQRAALLLAAPRNLIERLFTSRADIVGLLATRERCAGFATFRALVRSFKGSPRLHTRVRPIFPD